MTETTVSEAEPMRISPELAARVWEELGENVYLCYQCSKCSSGCPVSEFFDWQPNQIMRALQLGQEEIALESDTPWLCASCQTCTTRCPQGLDINRIMDFLTREASARGFEPRIPEVQAFNEAFMREVRLWRRSYEPGLMAEMKLRLPEHLLDDLDLYLKMFRKGKVSLLPEFVRPPREVKPDPGAVDSIAYYPGCSLHSTAQEFDASTRAVCEALDLKLSEPESWVCCGSSAAHRADPEQALLLPMTNLAMIERLGFPEVTMPCAACFNRHKAALYETRHHEQGQATVEDDLGYTYKDRVRVNTLIDTLREHVELEEISARVERPLEGLPVVCYYGCLLTRPPDVTEARHPENPTNMDELVEATGAKALDWSYKTSCCGAAHSLTRPDIVLKLSGNLLEQARAVGAEAVVVACPLCHTNLDARQFQMDLDDPLPVLYFTQLLGLAFDLPSDKVALHKNLVDPLPLLEKRGLLRDSRGGVVREDEEEEVEDEAGSHSRRSRAPPRGAAGGTRRADVYEDIFDALDWAWKEVGYRYDVIAERPSFQDLFEGADIRQPEAAAEVVIANMLMEVIERVDRFSPWYTEPARYYGLVSRREPASNTTQWRLSQDGFGRWCRLIDRLATDIRKDQGLLLATLFLEECDSREGDGAEVVEVCCVCDPPRHLLMPTHLVASGQIICTDCGGIFRRVGDGGEAGRRRLS